MEIYLIRHTTPQIEKGICYGQADIPLSKTFQEEASLLSMQLPQNLDAWYSSPLSRCYRLTEILAKHMVPSTDHRLLEMNFGDWEMKKWDEINPEALAKWMNDFVNVAVPEGENFISLNQRVNEFMNDLIKTPHQKVAIVTHGGIIKSFVANILGLSLTDAFKITFDYASVTKVILHRDSSYCQLIYSNRV